MLTLSVSLLLLAKQAYLSDMDYCLNDSIDIIKEVLDSGGEFRLYPRGKSMQPFIVEGRDSVVLVGKAFDKLRKNDLAFYKRNNGQFVLHRVAKLSPDGTYVMCGDNQTALEKGISDAQIIGCVRAVYRGETLFNERTFSHRLYLAFWCCIPLRKLLRFSKRCALGACRKVNKIFKKDVD